MTYASRSASFSGRTRAAASVSKPLPVFRGRKRNPVSTFCKPASHESHNLVEAGPEVMGMDAFQEMFVAYRPKFVAMAHAILRNREDAEDAVQNALVSGYLHLRSFEGRSALTTWFTRIVLNAALMIRRKRKSPLTSPRPETGTSDDARWMREIPASQPDPDMVYAERETVQLINGVLAKMKPALRGDYVLRGRLYDFREIDENGLSARVAFDFELRDSKTGATVWNHSYSHDEPVKGKDVSAVVAAMNRNVQNGLGEVLASLEQYFSGHVAFTSTAAH
jgi:RNA polymerase sigma factor (sigma-70 family)